MYLLSVSSHHRADINDCRIQLLLVARLLINLREASEEDIYIESQQTSDEDEHNLSSLAMSEVSTLTFDAAGGRAPNACDPQTSSKFTFAGSDTRGLNAAHSRDSAVIARETRRQT